MRVDYFHTGGPGTGETFALDRVVNDGAVGGQPHAAGRRDEPGQVPLRGARKGVRRRVLYSRGFASIYGEWETTPRSRRRPSGRSTSRCGCRGRAQPVTVTLKKRQPDNSFRDVWSAEVDPASRFVNRAPLPAHAGPVWTVFENGPPSQKVDLLVIGEGYTRRRAAEVPRAT